MSFKPSQYNSLSPYLIVDEAQNLADSLIAIFDAEILRKYVRDNGNIVHMELKLDDSVLMLSDSTENYPAIRSVLHFYVPDVYKTFERAIQQGCKSIEEPNQKPGDPDVRGTFYDIAGNIWSIGTQVQDS